MMGGPLRGWIDPNGKMVNVPIEEDHSSYLPDKYWKRSDDDPKGEAYKRAHRDGWIRLMPNYKHLWIGCWRLDNRTKDIIWELVSKYESRIHTIDIWEGSRRRESRHTIGDLIHYVFESFNKMVEEVLREANS